MSRKLVLVIISFSLCQGEEPAVKHFDASSSSFSTSCSSSFYVLLRLYLSIEVKDLHVKLSAVQNPGSSIFTIIRNFPHRAQYEGKSRIKLDILITWGSCWKALRAEQLEAVQFSLCSDLFPHYRKIISEHGANLLIMYGIDRWYMLSDGFVVRELMRARQCSVGRGFAQSSASLCFSMNTFPK